MSQLREKQSRFVSLLGSLYRYADARGYELTLSDGYAVTGHMRGSLHGLRLAQDLNLFIEGMYVENDHPAWRDLGKFWKALDPEAAWGGDFSTGDFNHFSIEHDGKR